MNFSTVTTSGVFQYIQRDITTKIDVPDVEFEIIEKFNRMYGLKGIKLKKFSEHLPLAFVIVAESSYVGSSSSNRSHVDYGELVISTGYLTSIADGFDLKCTRRGT